MSKFNRNRRVLFLCNGFRKTDLGTDLIANAFRGSIQNTRSCSIIYLFEKRKGAYSCLPSKDSLNYMYSCIHYLYSKDSFTYGHSIQYKKCFLFVYIYIDLLKLKTYKLFENSDDGLS